jgi:translation initiation factor 4E|tara:strand:+ start:130 stop:675 length:546 start_codon:yes stop_codon:yes gene_type:complete
MDIVNTSMSTSSMIQSEKQQSHHPLYDKWVLWAHLPHDTDWTIKSYQKIMKISSVEQMLSLYSVMPEKLIRNCMLFLMREGVNPTWEDPANKEGGCFSFKVANKTVPPVWKKLSYVLAGETLSNNHKLSKVINGITISPKRAFCIVKIWMRNCSIQNPSKLTEVPGLNIQGCIFKKHKPEY